jgi:hypothetical protein
MIFAKQSPRTYKATGHQERLGICGIANFIGIGHCAKAF